jgi:CelD/BcsL family acetyltransferase involved in cellulose biosynthesis
MGVAMIRPAATTRPLCTGIITDGAEIDRLGPAWDALYARCPHATPFQSHGWLRAWWATFAGSNAAVVTVTRNGDLLAVAPFYVHRDARGIRHLRLIGHGTSDYPDVLVAADDAAETMTAVWDTLARVTWHVGMFTDLTKASPLLAHPVPPEFCTSVVPDGVAPVLSLPADLQTFQDGLPHGLRRTLRRCRKRLEQRGPISFDRVSDDESETMLETLFQLHTDHWQQRNEPGVLAEPRVREFHRLVMCSLGRDGTLRLWTLRCGGDMVGVKYTFWRNGCVWSYISGINHAYKPLSAGALLFEDVIGEAIAAGCTTFDFLRGGEDYKYVWGARDKQLYRLVVART